MERGFREILRTLKEYDVDFIVVGGAAAVLQGVPVTTRDMDIVHSRAPENAERLAAALEKLGARYRHDDRNLRPNASHLIGPGHQLTTSAHGDLDCLGTIEEGAVYEDLLPDIEVLSIGDFRIQVLSLERLKAIKQKLDRPKDKFMLLQIEATIDERRKREP